MAEAKKQHSYDHPQADETAQAYEDHGMVGDGQEYAAGEEVLEARLAALEAERDDLRDRMLRAFADAENSRKRAEKDRRDGLLYGATKLARDLMPVYDNLTRALAAADENTRASSAGFVEGVELTLRELTNILARHGVERISPEPGDIFDPHLHQAMFEAAVPDFKAGQIIQVMAEGFRLHDQLLRPAQVGVSSTPVS